jgi:1,4-dihydroxy-2-naphthoyl-CoA hydrolase
MAEDIAALMTERQVGTLPAILGIEWLQVVSGLARARFQVERKHMAANGYMHAASVVAIADSACGYGCVASLPPGATGFTTIELKTNFLGTAREGDAVATEAKLTHGGRTTQVWDAEVTLEGAGKTIALFRCTQMILYPR